MQVKGSFGTWREYFICLAGQDEMNIPNYIISANVPSTPFPPTELATLYFLIYLFYFLVHLSLMQTQREGEGGGGWVVICSAESKLGGFSIWLSYLTSHRSTAGKNQKSKTKESRY